MGTIGRAVWIGLFAILLSAGPLLADDHYDSITTIAGVTYTGVSVKRADPTGIDIVHDGGAVHIPIDQLPQDLHDKYAFTPDQVAAYNAAKDAQLKSDQAALATESQMDQDAAAKQIADSKRAAAIKGKAALVGYVVSKSAGILIVHCSGPAMFAPVSSMTAIGGGGNLPYIPNPAAGMSAPAITGDFALRNYPSYETLADGDAIKTVAYPDGEVTLRTGDTLHAYNVQAP